MGCGLVATDLDYAHMSVHNYVTERGVVYSQFGSHLPIFCPSLVGSCHPHSLLQLLPSLPIQ